MLMEQSEVKAEAAIPQATTVGYAEIHIKGQPTRAPYVVVGGRNVIRVGGWLKMASVKDEDLIEGDLVPSPLSFVPALRKSGLAADVFTFVQRLPETQPLYDFPMESDNIAAIPITTYTEWWEKQTDAGVRRAVRKAQKVGLTVSTSELDDAFVRGVMAINDETPVRQGRQFWHYHKSFEAVRDENNTFADRNVFVGAYLESELIGFMRLTICDRVLRVVQNLSMIKHYDKRPANAMLAKAVEICEQRGLSYLIYGNYIYNDPNSSLTEFKRRNGFQQFLLPRYYVPLTAKGQLAMRLGLHRGLAKAIPEPLRLKLLRMRNDWYARKAKSSEGSM